MLSVFPTKAVCIKYQCEEPTQTSLRHTPFLNFISVTAINHPVFSPFSYPQRYKISHHSLLLLSVV